MNKPWKYIEARDGIKRCYANQVGIAPTSYDVRLTFSEVVEVTDVKGEVEERVQVTMSWAAMKELAARIQQYLQAFETDNGQINTPVLASIRDLADPLPLPESTGLPN